MDKIAIFNSHFDPGHLKCVYDALELVKEKSGVKIWFTDITRKKYSTRLTEAFKKGETHADRYETSLIMAIDPSLIDEETRKSLPYLPVNLVDKIFKERLDGFKAFGMSESYCGDPASASPVEGEEILKKLTGFFIEDIEMLFSGDVEDAQPGLYGR
jgi:creatinine amidohydrolase